MAVWISALPPLFSVHARYGENDKELGAKGAKIFSGDEMEKFAAFKPAIFKLKKASHACYLDNPKAFNKRLLKFVEKVANRVENKDSYPEA